MKKIKLYLSQTRLTSQELSLKLHGFLMSQLPSDYADFLHQQETNPYSMTVIGQSGQLVWTVNLLNDEACDQIGSFLQHLDRIQLRTYPDPILIQKKEWIELSTQDLLAYFYGEREGQTFTLELITPTSFKTKGQYSIFPSMRLLFQSLMQKYSRLVEEGKAVDEDLLAYLDEHARITSYHLKTHYYSVHKGKIPAFQGKLTFKLYGAATMRAYVLMLLKFGEYTGLGVKTSLGMGGMRVEERTS